MIAKTLFAQVINVENPKEIPSDLIVSPDCDILGFRFFEYNSDVLLDEILNQVQNVNKKNLPLLFIGTGDDDTDRKLLPEIAKKIKTNTIIANINEKTYKDIIPYVIDGGHWAVLKTPIDINLAKELNILSVDMGLPVEKIIMNTDIGGLGYGYEYGYSIMEKVKLEAKKDKYLCFPIFSDASYEALKTKEAKSNDFSKSWGTMQKRARMIELSACAGAVAAGADIVTVNNPDNIKILKGLV